jgi:hypothetical protein
MNGAALAVAGKGEPCVLRLRYNMSSSDYARNTTSSSNQANGNDSPIQQDPLVKIDGTAANQPGGVLQLALNTNQVARTFQDRSYVFYITPKTSTGSNRVLNLNTRGKRGNIVQTYPAVEYDFIPNKLDVVQGTEVIIQWQGSDYNPRRGCNDGEGGPYRGDQNVGNGLTANTQGSNQNSRADRMNLVAMVDDQKNYPNVGTVGAPDAFAQMQANSFFTAAQAKILAYGNAPAQLQDFNAKTNQNLKCLSANEINAINNENRQENHPRNCAEANSLLPFMPPQSITITGAVGSKMKGYSTRNNNFSNRDSKLQIEVINAGVTPTPVLLPQEFVAPGGSAKIVGDVTENATDVEAKLNADIPGFDPVENDDYGEGAKEGCTQDMLTFASSASHGASLPFVIGAMFWAIYALL